MLWKKKTHFGKIHEKKNISINAVKKIPISNISMHLGINFIKSQGT